MTLEKCGIGDNVLLKDTGEQVSIVDVIITVGTISVDIEVQSLNGSTRIVSPTQLKSVMSGSVAVNLLLQRLSEIDSSRIYTGKYGSKFILASEVENIVKDLATC